MLKFGKPDSKSLAELKVRQKRYLYFQHLSKDLSEGVKHNKKSIEKIGNSYDIANKNEIKELTELVIVTTARAIAHSPGLDIEEKYQKIVDLYKSQVNLSHRTSQSVLLQQYSTPAPIAYLAGIFVDADHPAISAFEPSAGNGLLTIAANPQNVIVNEIDDLRRSNLEEQGYKKVLNQDATMPFKGFEKTFDAILTNPPFGKHQEVRYETFPIRTLDHLMALRALDTMKDNGKAAIIIGGHNRYDNKGRLQKGDWRFFFNYLYSRYNVVDLINIDGHKLYSRQGTSFDVRLILIEGRKPKPYGAAPIADEERDKVVYSFAELYERVIAQTERRTTSFLKMHEKIMARTKQNSKSMKNILELEAEALALELELLSFDELGMPYTPASESCTVLDTVVPDSMGYETHAALQKIKGDVGGDIDEYVRKKLNYKRKTELCKALSAEQIDAVALAIYNIEERGQGMIIGDQTGIGKGRVAASIIRYGVEQGLQPIFITEKANLFSDIYRDLVAIGSDKLAPFIVNGRESKTDIKDEDGEVIYQALTAKEQETIFDSQKVPRNFDFVVATYSQFNSPDKKPTKPFFLTSIAEDNIIILDEAHNSSGSGNTGTLMQSVLVRTRGVVFLSATFAKRVDNMPIYSMKTAISEASLSRDALVEAVMKGGVALQEILASQLVAEGQMIRRERSFEGVEVNYITLWDKEQEHKAISDNITEIMRSIIGFQGKHVDKVVEQLDEIAVAEGKEVDIREGTNRAGVDNLPYFSKVFQVINQMLFSIKAEAVAEQAIKRLKEGKKPVIAFASTMGSFIEQMENEHGLPVSDGDVINADFSTVLQRGLDGILRYTVTEPDGSKSFKTFDLSELSPEAQTEYLQIGEQIKSIATGITISPIDVIIDKIESAGYSVAEVTGRKYKVQLGASKGRGLGKPGGDPNFKVGDKVRIVSNGKVGTIEYYMEVGEVIPGRDSTKNFAYEYSVKLEKGGSQSVLENDLTHYQGHGKKHFTGIVLSRKRENTNDAFRRFNNNEVDVLLINQSGSTGASAHAIVTSKVPNEKVKQRVMIVLQPELDISTEVQKRGRINRTGQLYKPKYDYINSAIPAEQRLMMMLQKKLKSLDANTTSNQKSSTKILDVPDFLNKYGDKIVIEYLKENPAVNVLIDDPLKLLESNSESESQTEDAAHRVSGRIAVLSTEMQQEFYNEVSVRYNEFVEYLKQIGEYDLEVEAMNLDAETITAQVVIVGKGGRTAFGDDSILETVNANVLKKPFTTSELNNLITESLHGRHPREIQQQLKDEYEAFRNEKMQKELSNNETTYDALIKEVPSEKKLKRILEKEGVDEYKRGIAERERQLEESKKVASEKIKKAYSHSHEYIMSMLDFFYIGRNLNYPVLSLDAGQENIYSVFLGFMIDKKKKNPYAPSDIKLKFAIAGSNKYIAIPGSYIKDINAIKGASIGMPESDKDAILAKWEAAIKETSVDRKVRHIITGNLLQAFASYKGKLVSYTTKDGATKKGILMPEHWSPTSEGQQKVNVPIARALKIIRSLTAGGQITTDNGVSIFRQSSGYKIIVSSARSQGGEVYLDKDILILVNGRNFEKVSNKMAATIDESNIESFVNILQEKFSDSVSLRMDQFNIIKNDIPKKPVRETPVIAMPQPKQTRMPEKPKLNELELEAMALELELELLRFAA